MVAYQRLEQNEIDEIAALLNEALARQKISLSEFARRAGVSQPKAFEVANKKFKNRTPNLRKLELYIHMTLDLRERPDIAAIDSEVGAFLAAGGTVEELRAILGACTMAKSLSQAPIR